MIYYQTGYKYTLSEQYSQRLGVLEEYYATVPNFVTLVDGILTLSVGYAWDGPSGPTWDSDNFMTPSLVHDALYQLMRAGQLPQECRKIADDLLFEMCRERGMTWFRAWYVWKSVRWFGSSAARDPRPILTAP